MLHVAPVAIHDGETANPHDEIVAREIWSLLHRFYPDHDWRVTVDHESGEASVKNLSLSFRYGFELLLARWVRMSPEDKIDAVKWAGGEFLERFNVRRGKYSEGDYNGLVERARVASGV